METIKGFVETITYSNDETGYAVFTMSTNDKNVTVVGTVPSLREGEFMEADGEWTTHPTYGPQFKLTAYRFVAPQDKQAALRYLESGAVKGIGETLAKRVVALFGDDTLRVLEEEPERLSEVKGISERKAMEIASSLNEKRDMRNAIMYLQQYNISLNMAAKIYKFYGEYLYTVLKENPYRLAEDIDGIGFKTADEIARGLSIAEDSDFRVRAAVMFVLSRASQNGHTYLPKDVLLSETEALLNIQVSDFDHLLGDLLIDKKVSLQKLPTETRVYSRSMFFTERSVAMKLQAMNIAEDGFDEAKNLRRIQKIEEELNVSLNEEQRQAVLTAAQCGITVLTGGPGTGKTTTINVIIHYFMKAGLDLMLAAPTGRAAKRMSEATGFEAQTIHRLLEYSGNPEDAHSRLSFQRNDQNPLETDVVIIDEVSMVDISLMHALLSAMVPGMRLILVGDMDQLPSVGPGEVLHDIIASQLFPVVKLQKIYRQAEDSDIILNAHRINEGEIVEPKFSKDFLFVQRDDIGTVNGAMITLIREKLPKYLKTDPMNIQVLVPTRKGNLGVEELNRGLQAAFNPKAENKPERTTGTTTFRLGDKVMQTKNNYDLGWRMIHKAGHPEGAGVFNGDIGFITAVNKFSESLTILFDDEREVDYPFSLLDDLELAYAVTIHKSQGSEYPAVILPLLSPFPEQLFCRNLLYTGVTRARQCVVILGRYDTFKRMILNKEKQKRYSGLADMLRELYEPG